jgi:Protein of unknown function (DUF4229)
LLLMRDAHLGRDLALYTLARIALVAAVVALLMVLGVPFLVSLAIAVVVGFPASLLLFRGLNRRVTEGLAERGAARYEARERLRAELRGEQPPEAT